jgi:dTDP-4-amino-4,6-dideoxygalactose transaminase
MEPQSFIPFALPTIGEEEITEVVDAMRSGWLTTGPKTKRFELDFADFLGGDIETIAVNSATSGLHLALEAIGVGVGDEVITTVHTFTATAEVVRYLGAHPVFVDVDPHTLNIDIHKVEAAITEKTKAIIPVHFAGLACDMDAICELAQRYGLRVIEDAAHALPTTYKGKLIGALESDVTVYSFYANKTICTGEGGMVVTRNSELAKRCRVMRLHGIDRDAFDRFTSTKPAWHYQIVAPGFKYNMTDMAASVGIPQLKKAWSLQNAREAIANRYNIAFQDLPILRPALAPHGDVHSWHLYVIQLDDTVEMSRDRFIEILSEKGIGSSVHYIPLHLHPYWKETYQLRPEDFPCASEAFTRIVSLPIYPNLTIESQEYIIQTIKQLLPSCSNVYSMC